MADVYRVSKAGLKVDLTYLVGLPRIPQPGSRMYKNLLEALLAYWIDTDLVLYHPPQPRLSDAFLELALADPDVLIQFRYDELSVTVESAIGTDPEVISAILDALSNVCSREMPNGELKGVVSVNYWVDASIPTPRRSKLLSGLDRKLSVPGLQVQKVTLRLPHGELGRQGISIDVGPSNESPNGLFLDYDAYLDKEASSSIVAVVSAAFKARGEILEKLHLQSDGNEEFASWFVTGSVRDGQKL